MKAEGKSDAAAEAERDEIAGNVNPLETVVSLEHSQGILALVPIDESPVHQQGNALRSAQFDSFGKQGIHNGFVTVHFFSDGTACPCYMITQDELDESDQFFLKVGH